MASIDSGTVAILRNHAPRISLLGIEVLLLCCEGRGLSRNSAN